MSVKASGQKLSQLVRSYIKPYRLQPSIQAEQQDRFLQRETR